jgi:excisionase family DNA binding protein
MNDEIAANVLQLLKPDDASKTLAISPRTLWSMTASGEIPAVRIGRSVRYDVADLRKWIDSKKRHGAVLGNVRTLRTRESKNPADKEPT